MNVLILTPDRVGSTLLQRLITVYMVANQFDRPVINLHELLNGLHSYYSPVFNQTVLAPIGTPGKHGNKKHQSLLEITEHLQSVDHFKTSRMAHYHIINRADSLNEQIPFYEYLNENFFIISTRRENLLEHALSWCISLETKKLNVYSHQEKIDTLLETYKNKITVDTDTLIHYLYVYKDYLDWVKRHFHVNTYFHYEKDLPRIEEFILNLNIFNGQTTKKTWKDTFDLEFNQWNRCHYLGSDLSGIGYQLDSTQQLKLPYVGSDVDVSKVQLQSIATDSLSQNLTIHDQKFLLEHGQKYKKSTEAINELIRDKVLPTGIPIKLQTMLEKKLLINNFDECVDAYNFCMTDEHSLIKGIGAPYTRDDIDQISKDEILQWHSIASLTQ
jgi:hypothetical protein